jgi:sortase (surface protein transpeptidase)
MGLPHAPNAGNHRGLIATVVAGVLAVSGVAFIGYAATHQEHAPEPPLSAAVSPTPTPSRETTTAGVPPAPRPTARPGTATASRVVGPVMPTSKPVSLAIPAISVQSSLISLGQTAQGSLEVPAPGPDYNKAGWYRYSPTPGSLGPAVIAGHVDSKAEGRSVFYDLGDLHPRDKVLITRADGKVATFAVDDVKRFHKSQFPSALVYGNTDHAALRLITCGGPFDRDTGSYRDNIVVMASLVRG